MKYLYTAFISLVFAAVAFSQTYTIKGEVSNEMNGEKLPGTSVFIKALNVGGISDANGMYSIKGVQKGTYDVLVSFVGFNSKTVSVQVQGDVVLNFKLQPGAYLLGETVVQGTRAKERETPIAFSEIKGAEIEFKLSSRDVPHVLQQTPGIYASNSGGGAGDSRLMVRGFDQRNTAIMINGVPVNDMENGWVYWSNWAGIGDVTSSIQVQRGLGASPYSVSAIGGVLNVLTTSSVSENFTRLKYETGSDNLNKVTASFKTDIAGNVGMTALVSRKTWNGYVDNTYLNEFTYFFSIGGLWGDHALELQAVGSPQNHGQRTSQLTINEFANRGRNFNGDWGYLNGKALARGENYFHKPAFNLNHTWQINNKSVLSSVLYLSTGTGGGTGTTGTAPVRSATSGLLDWDGLWAKNVASTDTLISKTSKKSVGILRSSRNDHIWYGLLSTFNHELSTNLKLNVGIDGRYYVGNHYRTLDNLIGGDYYIDNTNKNRTKNQMILVGDKIEYYNDGVVAQYGGFGQVEYNNKVISAFINVSASNTGYQRIDYFNFLDSDPNQKTAWQNFLGYTAKGGVNYNLDKNHNVFANAGYFSKAPIFNNVFNTLNSVIANIQNEKIIGLELGYGFSSSVAQFNINLFYTQWKDKSFARSITLTDGTIYSYNFTGANAEHKGIEFEGKVNVTSKLKLLGHLSVMDNKWTSNVDALVTPDADPTKQTRISSYINGLKVGDFAQITGSFQIEYTTQLSDVSKFTFNPIYTFFGQNYSFFNPDQRSKITEEGVNSWRLPDFFLIDVHVGYGVNLHNFIAKEINFGLHMYNVLNQTNIIDATDGTTHTSSDARVYYGRDRWYSASVSLSF